MREHWTLDSDITYLNHGSFGACPRVVQQVQQRFRDQLEREPVTFLDRELEGMLDAARAALGELLGADRADLVFVSNATEGVNTVLQSLPFAAGDELVVTDHAYNACRNALDEVAQRRGAVVRVAKLPWPVPSSEAIVDAVVSTFSTRTKLLLIDHVTSPTALVLPVAKLCEQARARGIEVLVDGAHAPGMVPIDLGSLRAHYYTGNCHKWLCAPKGAAFLWVERALQPKIRPLSISHGRNSPRKDRSKFLLEFDWMGTADPTPFLCIPAAIDFLRELLPGGMAALMERNRKLAIDARAMLLRRFDQRPLCPEELLGSMASISLPDAADSQPRHFDLLQDSLLFEDRIEVPIFPFPAPPKRLLRVSAQAYNTQAEYERLADALTRRATARGSR